MVMAVARRAGVMAAMPLQGCGDAYLFAVLADAMLRLCEELDVQLFLLLLVELLELLL